MILASSWVDCSSLIWCWEFSRPWGVRPWPFVGGWERQMIWALHLSKLAMVSCHIQNFQAFLVRRWGPRFIANWATIEHR